MLGRPMRPSQLPDPREHEPGRLRDDRRSRTTRSVEPLTAFPMVPPHWAERQNTARKRGRSCLREAGFAAGTARHSCKTSVNASRLQEGNPSLARIESFERTSHLQSSVGCGRFGLPCQRCNRLMGKDAIFPDHKRSHGPQSCDPNLGINWEPRGGCACL